MEAKITIELDGVRYGFTVKDAEDHEPEQFGKTLEDTMRYHIGVYNARKYVKSHPIGSKPSPIHHDTVDWHPYDR